MKFLSFLVAALVFAPVIVSAQTAPTTSPTSSYPQGYTPPFNNVNNGIQGIYGSSQCGTSLTAGISNTNSGLEAGSNKAYQISVTHNFGNPCQSQKDQTCTTGKMQIVQNNPNLSKAKIEELLAIVDSFCK